MADAGTPIGTRRHTSGFDIVGQGSDPTPGDVDEMGRLEARYREIGDNAGVALTLTKKGGDLSQGKGSTMDSLNKAIGNLPDKLQRTVDSYEAAADAFKAYAPVLKQAQDQVDQAMDQALQVSGAAGASVAPLPQDATDDQKTQNKQQQDAKDAAQGKLSAARQMAADAKSLRDDAASKYAQQIDEAASDAIPERNIFQKIADFFKKFPFVQIILAALVAIVSVVFPVAGALLAAGLFVFNQVVAIGSGNFKLGDFLAGLVSIVPIGAAIGAAGRGLATGAETLGGFAGKLAGVADKVGGSITNVGNTIKNAKTVQGIINNPAVNSSIGKGVVTTIGKFGEGAVTEVGVKAANGEQITPAGVLAGAAAGGLAAGGLAGIKSAGGLGNIIKGKGTLTPVKGPQTEVPSTIGSRAKESAGELAPEVASIGAKVGVSAATGEDPLATLNDEGRNLIPKTGSHGTKIASGKLDGLFQPKTSGPSSSSSASGASSTPSSPTPGHANTDPADVPLPPSPTSPTSPASGHANTDPADIPLPTSPTSPTSGHANTDPADIPLPPSPTVGGRPTPAPLTIPTKTSASPDSPTAPTTPTAPATPFSSPTTPSAGGGGTGEDSSAGVNPADVPLPPSPTG
ncbi:putative T7SS-secreted protein [Streptomyces sp. NBC_01497]|uniref:putative T7SS-secreted protein n=1 Tax=Streptomyces sp. NBC_01497 TaxID=2903885 RepID=UPI002E36C1EF|nr:hypothetical protein [Streptomyces sp. NBC_01497]